MNIVKVNPIKFAQVVFDIVKQSFNRSFDSCPKSVDEVIEYIRDSEVYMLEDKGSYVGYFVLKKEKNNIFELKSIAVPDKYQGKGYGSLLMKKVLDLTKGHGVHFVTHPKNISGLFLYLKNGFEITGWIDNYYGDGQPRLKLEKVIGEES